MLINRITPKTRNRPNKKRAIVSEVWSTESKGSNSDMPRRDQQRCLTTVHQLNGKNIQSGLLINTMVLLLQMHTKMRRKILPA